MPLTSAKKRRFFLRLWLKHDLPAGISVFLVAIPLCLGIALASGAPLYAGILSGIIGGVVVSLVSSAPLAVSGPAAGLTTIVSAAIISFGDYRSFLLCVIVAGIFQVTLGVLKLGVIAYYFPSAVIKGMLAAIGIILISKQIPIALGYDRPDFWSSGLWSMFSSKNFFGSVKNLNLHLTRGAIIITVCSLLVMVFLQAAKQSRLKWIPAPLLAVVTGILVNIVFQAFASSFSLKATQLVDIPFNIVGQIKLADVSRLF